MAVPNSLKCCLKGCCTRCCLVYLADLKEPPSCSSVCCAQVRLHALHLCDELFRRSKAFRGHLANRFTPFLELTIGYRQRWVLDPDQLPQS